MNTHNINVGAGRTGHNFEDAMSHIAREAEAQRMLEARAQQRQALVSKIKKIAGFLFGLAVIATAFCYHSQLQDYLSTKFASSKPQISSSTTASLNKAEAAAQKRDQALDEIAK